MSDRTAGRAYHQLCLEHDVPAIESRILDAVQQQTRRGRAYLA
jgi:hypothetical protein